jgi:hypothetical protein
MRALVWLALVLAVLGGAPRARAQDVIGGAIGLVKYVPNRVLDALDVVRLRVRAGPGAAVTARASRDLSFFRGRYVALFAGLPGPRNRRWPRLPAGLESRAANEPDESVGALPGTDPGYSPSEWDLGFQAGVLGLEVGVDPLELLDFAFGLITLDPGDDDW